MSGSPLGPQNLSTQDIRSHPATSDKSRSLGIAAVHPAGLMRCCTSQAKQEVTSVQPRQDKTRQEVTSVQPAWQFVLLSMHRTASVLCRTSAGTTVTTSQFPTDLRETRCCPSSCSTHAAGCHQLHRHSLQLCGKVAEARHHNSWQLPGHRRSVAAGLAGSTAGEQATAKLKI